MNAITRFQHNWNKKLDCDVFTTIRKFEHDKYDFYKKLIGEEIEIELNGELKLKATLLRSDLYTYDQIPEYSLCVDTGASSKKEADKIFAKFGIKGKCPVIILLFKAVGAL